MELLLGTETGNCAFAVLPTANDRTMLLECVFILEAIGALHLHADRFLPPTPVRVVISHKLVDVTDTYREATWEARLQKGSPYKLLENADIARRILPAMVKAATSLAGAQAAGLCQSALKEANHLLGHELQRLQMLQQVNDHIRPQEIKLARRSRLSWWLVYSGPGSGWIPCA